MRLLGSNPRAMGYDGENRPLWVARAGKITCYVYGADGTRLKKIEGVNDNGPATNRGKPCTDLMPAAAILPAGAVETATFNQVEVRKWGTGAAEVITTYPHPNIRLIWTKAGTVTSVEAQALHRAARSPHKINHRMLRRPEASLQYAIRA